LLVQGNWSEVRELARVTRAQGSPLERHMAITILGNLAYCQGDPQQAWAMVRELLPRGPDSEPEDSLFPYAIEMLRLATKLALDASDLVAAHGWLKTHDRWLDWSGSLRDRPESQLLRARLYELEGDMLHAERFGHEALLLATEPRQPLMFLEAHLFLGQIAGRVGRHADAERQLTLALDLADSCSAPYERARALLGLASSCLATGRAEDARRLLGEVRGIATDLGAAPLIVAADDMETSLESATGTSNLTSRELEVLRLVTEGLTDAEVADQLYISPRTVGQHLRSIYNKLGVSSRTSATRVAIEDKLV
jgi:DNA-binding CsgD family transcriptional regulator